MLCKESQKKIIDFTATKESWLLLPDSVHVTPTVERVVQQHQCYLREWKQFLKQIIHDIHLPVTPIDVIVNQLGGYQCVAEISERFNCVYRHEPNQQDESVNSLSDFVTPQKVYTKEDYLKNSYYYYHNRGSSIESLQTTNSIEWSSFLEGKKRVLFLSEQAGFGTYLSSYGDISWVDSPDKSDIDVVYLSIPSDPCRILNRMQGFFARSDIHGTVTFLTTEPSQRVLARSAVRLLETHGALYRYASSKTQHPWFMVRDVNSPEGHYAWLKCMTLITQQTSPTPTPSCRIFDELILPGIYLQPFLVVSSEKSLYGHYLSSSAPNRLFLMNQCLRILGFTSLNDTLNIPSVLERLIGMDFVMQKMIVGYYYEILDHVLDHLHYRGSNRSVMSIIKSGYIKIGSFCSK